MSKVKCPYCKEIIESISVHDYRRCSCGKTFIDGGSEYIRTNPHAIIIKDESN